MQDMAGSGASPVPFLEDVDNLLAAPMSPASDTAETQLGDDDTDAAPPSLRGPSPPQYLRPPSRDESASSTQYLEPPSRGESASSTSTQSGKRRRERSPPQRRQASRTQYEPRARGRGHSSPTPRRQCKDEDPTPFKRQYLVVFVYVCFTLLLTSYCRIYAITAYLSV